MRHISALSLACVLLILLPTRSARASTLRVPEDYPTISAAVAAAVDGDVISVDAGTYTENLSLGRVALTLESRQGPGTAIIQGSNGPVLSFDGFLGFQPVTVTGFTLTGGTGFLDYFLGHLGGAVFTNNAADPVIRECILSNNTADQGYGGAVCAVNSSDPLLVDCLLIDNQAAYGGAAAGIYNGFISAINCTLTNNTATSYGGGVISDYYGGTRVDNSIIWGNTLPSAAGQFNTINYSDVEGGHAGQGNIDADPLFTGDYQLQSSSPCVDRGDRMRLPSGYPSIDFAWDLGGNSRILNGDFDETFEIDMGAYEFSNVYLSVTGSFTPGGTITLATTGEPLLSTIMLIGFSPGTILLDPLGYIGIDFSDVFGYLPWPSAPASIDFVLPDTIPSGFDLVFQAIAWEQPGRGNLSDPVTIVIQ